MNYKKIYVDVILKNDIDGNLIPLKIIWEDGEVYLIDRLLAVCKASSLKVGGCGTRYSVRIYGKEKYLFHEEDKWFMEIKENFN
ncbi:MAG: hypothetical protein R3Y35_08065 [Clostridia bacterium]